MKNLTQKQVIYTILILAIVIFVIIMASSLWNKKSSISNIGDVTIKYIDVKATLLAVAEGHYLSGESRNSGSTLYYDGKSILDSKILGKGGKLDSESLSDNGLHYTFVVTHYLDPAVPTTAVHDLYVDGKKVESIAYPSADYPFGSPFDNYPFVTNDGNDYFYLRDNQGSLPKNNSIDLIKDGKSIFNFSKASSFNRLIASQDGLTTLVVYGTGNEITDPNTYVEAKTYSVLLDNKEIFKTSTNSGVIPYSALSPNGKHYAIVKDTKLFIDGQPRMPDKSFVLLGQYQLQITDSGHYLLIHNNSAKPIIYIDDKEYIPPTGYDQVDAGHINDDASHYLIHSAQGWLLDNNPISFSVDNVKPYDPDIYFQGKQSLQMQGNTIYVYKADPTYINK